MEANQTTINTISNSLNAYSGSARHKYANTKDKQQLYLSELLDQAQCLILLLAELVESQKKHTL